MKLNINVPDKMIKAALGEAVDCNIHSNWDQDVIEKAKIPAVSAVVDEIFKDAKFAGKFQKDMQDNIVDMVDGYDLLTDLFMNWKFPQLTKMNNACEAACAVMMKEDEAKQAVAREKQERDRVKNLIKILQQEGYTITKGK